MFTPHHMSQISYFFVFLSEKVVEIVSGWSVINGAYPSNLFNTHYVVIQFTPVSFITPTINSISCISLPNPFLLLNMFSSNLWLIISNNKTCKVEWQIDNLELYLLRILWLDGGQWLVYSCRKLCKMFAIYANKCP